jgi:protein-tyrosine phosphatase
MKQTVGVLFVCLGNICRSPLAEALFRDHVERAGLVERFEIDSAGTTGYHAGDTPDSRTVEVAARRGVRLEHRARQVVETDIERFDYMVAMDLSNLGKLERLIDRAGASVELHLLRSFDAAAGEDREVPDPYFGGPSGFEDVHDMVERATAGLLEHIREAHGL